MVLVKGSKILFWGQWHRCSSMRASPGSKERHFCVFQLARSTDLGRGVQVSLTKFGKKAISRCFFMVSFPCFAWENVAYFPLTCLFVGFWDWCQRVVIPFFLLEKKDGFSVCSNFSCWRLLATADNFDPSLLTASSHSEWIFRCSPCFSHHFCHASI